MTERIRAEESKTLVPTSTPIGELSYKWALILVLLLTLNAIFADTADAIDPPHSNDCTGSCHMIHGGFGGGLFNTGGLLKANSNSNLCITCHTPGGPATAYAFADADQAVPGGGGTSHRWDSGVSGHMKGDLANTSTGTVYSGGAFTGRIETTYTVTVSAAGDVGTARFDWLNNGGVGSNTSTVRDEFNTIAYTNDDGSVNWAGDWIENDPQGGGASVGNAQVVVAELRLDQQGFAGSQVSAAREADLSGGVTDATFRFDFRTDSGVDSTDAIAIEVSNDGGGNYTVLETITGISGASSGARSYDILAWASVNTRIRFRITNSYHQNNEFFYADNVQIEYAIPVVGDGSNIITDTDVPLADGLTVSFVDGTASPSFVLGDSWTLYARADLRSPDRGVPAEFAMAARLDFVGKIVCSTCHDQHNQSKVPFDALAPPYTGSGTGAGRHFQRNDNDTNQMCKVCHEARNVQDGDLGSHPVGVLLPAGDYRAPTNLPLDSASNVQCMSCHALHFTDSGGANGGAGDGYLLRLGMGALCFECHTLADPANGSHFDAATGVLWPGGQYGSSFPAHSADKRGWCINCHWPHGWPDDGNAAQDYPSLLVESRSDLCVTCHDGAPASDQLADFASTLWVTAPVNPTNNMNLNTRHDVKSADQAVSGADLTCNGCHDPHTASPSAKVRDDPDPADGRVPAPGQTWAGSDLRSEWCLDCHDGSLPAGIVPPTIPLTNIRDTWLNNDDHGTRNGSASLKAGYGWADDDILTCTACHVEKHGSSNLFQLRTTIYSKDGSTPIPSDCGGTNVALTDNSVNDSAVNGYCFCNTCHEASMGGSRDNCFACHTHDDRF